MCGILKPNISGGADMGEQKIMRDAKGRFLPGSTANPGGYVRESLARFIKDEFDGELYVLDGKRQPKNVQHKKIFANALAQLISTGEVRLPDRIDENGNTIPGRRFKFSSDEWMRHVIRVLRYVEPPVTTIELAGGVEGIIFDKEIIDVELEEPADDPKTE
jgi:hypothetical protein